ncbi:MAG TPA: glycogen debranching enzyme family protein [Oscillatoriales cyanobacterium M59_W2019_021]|nr:glycogen debranching enzyme family protein [Oscillatoriales cyanobacterium M59_W2019_021]
MSVACGREICGDLRSSETREWLVTNGIGGYGCGTIPGLPTRQYHGLLVAALNPPLGHTLLLAKLDETAVYDGKSYGLATNRWADGTVSPQGYRYLESFHLDGTIPVWRFACADALLEKRVWMQQGENTTYIRYTLLRGSSSLVLSLQALANYRDRHGGTTRWDWHIDPISRGIRLQAFAGAVPFYLFADVPFSLARTWYEGFDLAVERYRGTGDRDDYLHAATFDAVLEVGASLTIVASTESQPCLDGDTALEQQQHRDRTLLELAAIPDAPPWIEQLILAADSFIVDRSLPEEPEGKTVIAGYPWFGDWGRDTMISLPGLTLSTGRPEIARTILQTFARYVDGGMLPNVFPDGGETPAYNTVDASLWYVEAVRSYYNATADEGFLAEIFPTLQAIIDGYRRGTRYQIHLDDDGLIYAGEPGEQLTWMDAKVEDWVVTPRMGKPVEISALWYNALKIVEKIARRLNRPGGEYRQLAENTATGFDRFWNPQLGYCYDVLDTPNGNDASLRPNQLFAVSLSEVGGLLSASQQRTVVDTCQRSLLTSGGLRSLSPEDPQYRGLYGGDRIARDGAYHQGTVWGWLIGPFVRAHLQVYGDRSLARSFLEPMKYHLWGAGLGNISEIFDGDPPFVPRGCFAQAWSVAEVLRTWQLS